MALIFELSFHNIQLSLRFIEILTRPVHFLLFLVDFDPVSSLDVFLDFHSHNISIDRQTHFIRHLIDFTLLLLNSAAHITQPRFQA